jgi:hypothetical protein
MDVAAGDGFPDRRTLERALREAGLSARLAKRLLSAGWPALVGEHQAERDELRAQLADLTSSLRDGGARP